MRIDRPRSMSQPAFEKSVLPKWHLSELASHLWGVNVGGLEVQNTSKACHRPRHLACHRMRHRLAKVRFRAESVRCRAPELFSAGAVAMFHGQRDFVQPRVAQVKIQLKPKLFLVIGTLLSTLPQGFRHHGWFVRSWPCLCSKMFLIRVCGVSGVCVWCVWCVVCGVWRVAGGVWCVVCVVCGVWRGIGRVERRGWPVVFLVQCSWAIRTWNPLHRRGFDVSFLR